MFMGRLGSGSYGQPVDLVRVCGETSAAGILLVTGTVNHDGVVECSCCNFAISRLLEGV